MLAVAVEGKEAEMLTAKEVEYANASFAEACETLRKLLHTTEEERVANPAFLDTIRQRMATFSVSEKAALLALLELLHENRRDFIILLMLS